MKEIEGMSENNIQLNEKENAQLNKEIAEINLRQDGKIRCLFNTNDHIFNLSDVTELMPSEKDK